MLVQKHEFICQDYGFMISYPNGWDVHAPTVGVIGEEFLFVPSHVPKVYDPILNRDQYNPFVNVVITEWPDSSENLVDRFEKRRSQGYEEYKFSKTHKYIVAGATNVKAYEFRYGYKNNTFIVVSLLVQKDVRLYVVTAQSKTEDFKNYRNTLYGIVFSFQLL